MPPPSHILELEEMGRGEPCLESLDACSRLKIGQGEKWSFSKVEAKVADLKKGRDVEDVGVG